MSGAPFRDLFVELPAALFEALRAIGEAAVNQARHPAPREEPRPWLAWLDSTARALAEYYGWHEILRTERNPLDLYITLVVRLDCRHGQRQRYRFDELSMVRADSAASRIDLVCNVIETTERSCQCVQRPRLTETP